MAMKKEYIGFHYKEDLVSLVLYLKLLLPRKLKHFSLLKKDWDRIQKLSTN